MVAQALGLQHTSVQVLKAVDSELLGALGIAVSHDFPKAHTSRYSLILPSISLIFSMGILLKPFYL